MEGAPVRLGLKNMALEMQRKGEMVVTLPFSPQAVVTGSFFHHLVAELLQMPSNGHPCL